MNQIYLIRHSFLRYFFKTLLISLFPLICFSQVANIQWATAHVKTGFLYVPKGERLTGIKSLVDGSFVTVGINESESSNADLSLMSMRFFDSEGKLIDQRFNADVCTSLSATGAIVDEVENGNLIYGEPSNYDFCVWKTKPDGSTVWNYNYGGNRNENVSKMMEGFDDSYLIAGTTQSDDGDVGNLIGNTDAWLINIDKDGNVNWERNFGIAGENFEMKNVDTLVDDRIGVLYGVGWGIYLSIITSSGDLLWEKKFDVSSQIKYNTFSSCLDGGFILLGQKDEKPIFIKLNKQGEEEWQTEVPGFPMDFANDIKQSFDKGFVIAATKDYTAHMVKLDSMGNFLWNITPSNWDSANDQLETSSGHQIQIVDENNYVLGGNITGIAMGTIAPGNMNGVMLFKVRERAYEDADGDGYFTTEDCDDTDPNIHPGAEELCDNIDNNCNQQVDEDLFLYYHEEDKDGDGVPGGWLYSTNSCFDFVEGYVLISDPNMIRDCNDWDPNIYPGAEELCDGIDNNCNREVDEGLVTFTYYYDYDSDGFGDSLTFFESCEELLNGSNPLVLNGDDCDDTNAGIHPNADDIPENGIDEDCDGFDGTTLIQEEKEIQINIYPNPAFNQLNLEIGHPFYFIINNIDGKRMLEGKSERTINIESLPTGFYFLQITNERKMLLMGKFIKY